MWISKAHYNTLNELIESSQARNTEMLRRDGERERLKIENARMRADLDHMSVRLNQLEKERAQLTLTILGVKLPVPEFEVSGPVQQAQDLDETISFADMGDERALAMGISHNDTGQVIDKDGAVISDVSVIG